MIATALGSFPGHDYAATIRAVLGELEHQAPLPELVDRGPHAGMIPRAASLLPQMPIDYGPYGWRLCQGFSLAGRKASRLLRDDLEIFAEQIQDWPGIPTVTLAGPWTLAACLDLPRGGKAIGDEGAWRDIGQAWVSGASEWISHARQLMGREIAVQIDEPCLTQVVTGTIPDESGRHMLPPIPRRTVCQTLTDCVDAARIGGHQVIVHSCARPPQIEIMAGARPDALSLDIDTLSPRDGEYLCQWVRDGGKLWLGVLPTTKLDLGVREIIARTRSCLDAMSQADDPQLLSAVTLTPSCGLAGSPAELIWHGLRDLSRAADELTT